MSPNVYSFSGSALMLWPHPLCHDWSMESIPLVETLSDPRNIITVAFYGTLLILLLSCFVRRGQHAHPILCALVTLPLRCRLLVSCSLDCCGLYSAVQSSAHPHAPCSYYMLCYVALRCDGWLYDGFPHFHVALGALSPQVLVALPYVPSSNLFFYVGFVLAERVM